MKLILRGCSKSPVKMTLRIPSLACFSVPWKRKTLFLRARSFAHVLIAYVPLRELRRLELLGPFYPPFLTRTLRGSLIQVWNCG